MRVCSGQEFSQKELAAKSVSLNQLNEQNTSAVRESIVMQATLGHASAGLMLLTSGAGAHSRRRAAAEKGIQLCLKLVLLYEQCH